MTLDPDAWLAALNAATDRDVSGTAAKAIVRAYLAASRPSAIVEEPMAVAQCYICGKIGLSTIEGDGGTECQLEDGRWTCSSDCYYRATDPSPQPHTGRAGKQDGRTPSGETVLGMPVAAYMEETELGGRFATHWSTIPEHRNPVKLFAEADVRAALNAALTEPEAGEVTPALRDVAAERERQKSAEGWTIEHDDAHVDSELGRAAAAYALFAASPKRFTDLARAMRDMIPSVWPWDAGWWKPSDQNRRNLVKAGALILAEIERLDRNAKVAP